MIKIDLKETKKAAAQDIKSRNKAHDRYMGKFEVLEIAKSGSVHIALASCEESAKDAVAKVPAENLKMWVTKQELSFLEENDMESQFFVRTFKTVETPKLPSVEVTVLSLDNEASNERKEHGVKVSEVANINKVKTNKYGFGDIAAKKALQTANALKIAATLPAASTAARMLAEVDPIPTEE